MKKARNISFTIGFWLGVLVISLINLLLIVLKRDRLAYDIYLSVISAVALVVSIMVLVTRKDSSRPV